jgi:hypothetical protein
MIGISFNFKINLEKMSTLSIYNTASSTNFQITLRVICLHLVWCPLMFLDNIL